MEKKVSEDQLLTFGAYSQIATFLQHYNGIQVTYKTFASSWLLATFIGIGYALSVNEVNLPFHPLIIIAFVALASSTGIFLIWYLDLIICEQSIAAVLYEGIEMEKKYPWLPRYYNNVNDNCKLLSYINLKSFFYIGCIGILFITMGASLAYYVVSENKSNLFMLIPVFTILLIALAGFILISSSKKADPYERLEKLKRKHLV
ncbi:MAG TPA: hypothetical protein VLG49_00275 [Rhabdochlamydiaceae bacterium]|nr:hypothetical protein [Rhabdochlamydiaceae bacterium]